MNKEFIPYEQALELKELGFDEPCFFAFDNCSTPMRCSDLRTTEQKFHGVNYNGSTYTSQPTFSQAFRWFREKGYLMSISRKFFRLDNSIEYNYFICPPDTDEPIEDNILEEYTTYEEAELACLKKLIEIVKQKP